MAGLAECHSTQRKCKFCDLILFEEVKTHPSKKHFFQHNTCKNILFQFDLFFISFDTVSIDRKKVRKALKVAHHRKNSALFDEKKCGIF